MFDKTMSVCLSVYNFSLGQKGVMCMCELGLGVESLTLYSKKSHAKKMPLLHQSNFFPVTQLNGTCLLSPNKLQRTDTCK